MPPRTATKAGRKRRSVGRALIASAVLLALLWAASGFWQFGWRAAPRAVYVARGTLSFSNSGISSPSGPIFGPLDRRSRGYQWLTTDMPGARTHWNLHLAAYGSNFSWSVLYSMLILPLWPYPPLLGAAGVLLLFNGRRAACNLAVHRCPSCSYDLTGLASDTPCPECGLQSPDRKRAGRPVPEQQD